MQIPLLSNIKISGEVLANAIDGEIILLDLQSENYFGLDEVSTRIWQLLQENESLQKVFDTMLEEYDVSAKQLERDLDEFLARLLAAKLITISS